MLQSKLKMSREAGLCHHTPSAARPRLSLSLSASGPILPAKRVSTSHCRATAAGAGAQASQSAATASQQQQPTSTTQSSTSLPEPTAPSQNQSVPEADSTAVADVTTLSQQQQEQQLRDAEADEFTEVMEAVEVVVVRQEPMQVLQTYSTAATTFLTTERVGQGISVGVIAVLLTTLGIAIMNAYKKANTPRAKRSQQVDRNLQLVEGLNEFLPSKRSALTQRIAKSLQSRAGCTPVEAFRKYLWYLLRERKFDQAAVDDMVHLKAMLSLTDAQTAEALRERAQRVYDKYGTLMLNTEGMTLEGVQRKSTCKNLLRKLLYLTENAMLLPQAASATGSSSEADTTVVDLRKIFGATEADLSDLRIVNLALEEVDLESVMDLPSAPDAAAAAESSADSTSDSLSSAPKPPSSQ